MNQLSKIIQVDSEMNFDFYRAVVNSRNVSTEMRIYSWMVLIPSSLLRMILFSNIR